jgi:hypothetical protein
MPPQEKKSVTLNAQNLELSLIASTTTSDYFNHRLLLPECKKLALNFINPAKNGNNIIITDMFNNLRLQHLSLANCTQESILCPLLSPSLAKLQTLELVNVHMQEITNLKKLQNLTITVPRASAIPNEEYQTDKYWLPIVRNNSERLARLHMRICGDQNQQPMKPWIRGLCGPDPDFLCVVDELVVSVIKKEGDMFPQMWLVPWIRGKHFSKISLNMFPSMDMNYGSSIPQSFESSDRYESAEYLGLNCNILCISDIHKRYYTYELLFTPILCPVSEIHVSFDDVFEVNDCHFNFLHEHSFPLVTRIVIDNTCHKPKKLMPECFSRFILLQHVSVPWRTKINCQKNNLVFTFL